MRQVATDFLERGCSLRVSVSEGEFIIQLPELGLVAGGESYEDALGELVDLVGAQVADFLDRLDFYMQTDRRGQIAYLLKFALAAPDEERHPLIGDLHMSAERIEGLTETEAVELVHEHWARKK